MKKWKVADNLYIQEAKSGAQYYVARWFVQQKAYERSLGRVEQTPLHEAKEAARLYASEALVAQPARVPSPRVSAGIQSVPRPRTPQATSRPRARTAVAAPPESPYFEDVFDQAMMHIARVKAWRNPKSELQWITTISTYAMPIIGRIPVNDVTRDHILRILNPIWNSKNDTAKKLQQRLATIFSWLIMMGIRANPLNPAQWKDNLSFFLPSSAKVHRVSHFEAPTLDELRKVVAYCMVHPCGGSAALLFLIATVSRVGEVLKATRKDIDGNLWISPAENQKVATDDRRVPLSSLAQIALGMCSNYDALFIGYNNRVISHDYPRMRLRTIVGRAVTVHGIRSTFRDWCADENIPDSVAEMCLSHQWGNEVTQAYYRSDRLDARRDCLEKWAKAVMSRAKRSGKRTPAH